jgi:DNA helicase-2/ATP-dependent DNA helicase PcrA
VERLQAPHGRLDFTDLIERALYDVDRHPSAPEVFLLDEAQDFSRLELALATSWARHTDSTVIVGDPDQTLYTWRGSDHDALEQLPGHRAPGSSSSPTASRQPCTTWPSTGSARSPAAATSPTTPPTEPGEARRLPVSLREPGQLLDQVDEDLAAGRTVMILTTCGYMLAGVLHELRDQGTPFHNPYRPAQGAWNPLRGAARLAAFLRPDDRVWGEGALWTWGDLRSWTEPLQASGTLARGAKSLIDEKCRPDRFGESQAEKVAPTETVIELLGDDGTMSHPAFRLDTTWWAERLRASKAKTMAYPLEVCRRQGGQALVAKPRVTVGTIHSVKGGEADSVYVCPDLSKQGMWNGWHPGGPTRDQIIRMIYVALTRARERVTVMDPSVPEHVPLDLLTPSMEAIAA